MKDTTTMRLTGFIYQFGKDDFAKNIDDYVINDEENKHRDILIAYMEEKGVLCAPLMGGVWDIMDEKDDDFFGYMSAYTDGEWIWPQYIIEYMRKYPNIHLDEAFVRHVKTNKDKKKEVSKERVEELEKLFYEVGDWQDTLE